MLKIFFFLCSLALVNAQYAITWGIPASGQPYTPVTIKTGCNVTFTWSGGAPHDVQQLASMSAYTACTLAGATSLFSPVAVSGTYTTAPLAAGTYYYACTPHCTLGQKIQITASATAGDCTGSGKTGGGSSTLSVQLPIVMIGLFAIVAFFL